MSGGEYGFLLVRTVEDLRARLLAGGYFDDYNVALIGGMLRKLIMDQGSLLDLANRQHRMAIRFYVRNQAPPTGNGQPVLFWSVLHGMVPTEATPPEEIVALTKQELLRFVVQSSQGHQYTVKDLIQYAANVRGGIHAGVPRGVKEEELHRGAQFDQQVGRSI